RSWERRRPLSHRNVAALGACVAAVAAIAWLASTRGGLAPGPTAGVERAIPRVGASARPPAPPSSHLPSKHATRATPGAVTLPAAPTGDAEAGPSAPRRLSGVVVDEASGAPI